MSTSVARCANLNTKIDKAKMTMLRLLRKERFKVGFGCKIRLTMPPQQQETPPASIATITPEFSQSSRSP